MNPNDAERIHQHNGSHRHDSQHGTYRVPKCCGMPMAYSGQSGFYCLKCGSRG